MRALITQDARPNIVDASLTLISRMRQGAFVYIFWSQRRPVHPKRTSMYHLNISRLPVRYLNVTIHRTTWNAKPEIGPDGSSQTQRKPWVDGYAAGFAPPRRSGSGFWTVLEPNRTVIPVHTRTAGGSPGLVADTRSSTSTVEQHSGWNDLVSSEWDQHFYFVSSSWLRFRWSLLQWVGCDWIAGMERIPFLRGTHDKLPFDTALVTMGR